MTRQSSRRKFLASGAAITGVAIAGCAEDPAEEEEEPDIEDEEGDEEATIESDFHGIGVVPHDDDGYEIWGLDQGTDIIYIYEPVEGDEDADEPEFEVVEEIDLHETEGVIEADDYVPHMADFSSDYEYAAIACTAGSQTLIFDVEERELVEALDTGPSSHFAGFTPDDEQILVDVIGDGAIQQITVDLDNEEFELGENIEILETAAVEDHDDDFESANPICHDHAGDYSYHTLGPGVDDSGLVVLNWAELGDLGDDDPDSAVELVYSVDQLRTNCGTISHPNDDPEKFYLTAGAPSNRDPDGVGEWYVLDTDTHRPIDPETGEAVADDDFETLDVARDLDGYDTHGFWFVENDGERELWLLNRETDDGVVIDPETDEVIDEIDDYGPAPDIMWSSPDDEYMFVTLRGPNPQSGDPHAAEGDTPGISVLDVESREIVTTLTPAIEDYDDEE